MGIGDKQRIERERLDRYTRAVIGELGLTPDEREPMHEDVARSVMAVADSEIEPLQEQIEEQAIRLATQSGLRVRIEDVMRDLAVRGTRLVEKQNTGSAQGHHDDGRGLGYREAARLLAEALAATEGEQK